MKKTNKFLSYSLSFIATIMLLAGCRHAVIHPLSPVNLTVTDTDGNVYHTVVIGTRTWMVENLKTTHYRNGDPISTVDNWYNLTSEAYGDYDNDPTNSITYGRLYNWYAVNDARGIAPVGWHVPSDAEWGILTNYLGGMLVAGSKLKETGTTHWLSPNTGATNSSGFFGLPGGARFAASNPVLDLGLGQVGYYWTTTESAYANYTYAFLSQLWFNSNSSSGVDVDKRLGLSVRCIHD